MSEELTEILKDIIDAIHRGYYEDYCSGLDTDKWLELRKRIEQLKGGK